MKENYFSEPTDNKLFILNLDAVVIFNTVKKKQCKSPSIIAFFSLMLLFFFGNNLTAQSTIVFTSSSIWTCPAGVTTITVEAWGGGGRGGNSTGGQGSASGGGGGAYAKKTISVTPGNNYSVTVGLGGNYPAATNGGDSYFNNTTTVKAAGGQAPPGFNAIPGASGGLIANCVGDVVYNGGNGGDSPYTNYSGGGGGGAGSNGNGGNANLYTEGTGTSVGGGSGGSGAGSGNGAFSGTTIGGGGGGAVGNGYHGGDGARGEVRITIILPNGPGGVTANLQLWLRSDLLDGTTTVPDNSPVTTWYTQAFGDNAIKPPSTGAPVYRNNAAYNINFNSVVDFTNAYNSQSPTYYDIDATRQYLKGTSGFYSQDIFVVLIPDVTVTSALNSMDIFCGDKNPGTDETDGTGIGYGNYTSRIDNEVLTYALGTSSGLNNGYGVAQVNTSASYSSAGIINTRNNSGTSGQELYFNANNVVNSTSGAGQFANVSNSQYWIGRSEGWTGSLDARVAEVITYSSRTTDTQRSNIRSYLAIKYGITLGVNGTSMNYTNSAGSTIWDITANTGYNYNIAGIGRDDITKLNQKQSKSINTADDITIGLGTIAETNTANTNTFDTDKKFLVWGNNQGALIAQSVVVNISSGITTPAALVTDVSYKTINRIWKVVKTGGDAPSCKISIPASMLAATNTPAVTPGDYMMLISNSSTFDSTAEARIMTVNGSYLETNHNFDGTKYITFGFAPEKTFERCIQFDGINDYLDAGNVLNLNTSFTVSAWVNRNSVSQTILSKRNSAFTQGYDLSINSAGKAEMSWFVSGVKKTITSYIEIPSGIWHHIGVTFDGTTAKMYIDGVNRISSNLAGIPTATTNSFLIAAAEGLPPISFFKGSIDEVRVWDVALNDAQFRYVMNQEILSNGTLTNGAIIPNTITLNNISIIPWTNLKAYYPMSTYSFVNAKDKSSFGLTAALRNINTVDVQTAPLPYESAGSGNWETAGIWKNSTLQDLPNSISIEEPIQPGFIPPGLPSVQQKIDWNIVRVKNSHTLTSVGNKKVLGLVVEPTANIIATTSPASQTGGTKIEVSHYLKLDGKIDLVGRSQLVQTEGSDLDVTSAGSVERDQQGQANKYNYNYWGSPVGTINATTNNNAFTVAGVLRDGTNPATPAAITWIAGYDGKTSPFSLARYWIYKFDNKANAYANWTQIGETGSLEAGKGFTLKGAGTSGTENLTFAGKPNNGTITNTIGADQLLLVGNPYPSALDADLFITDNIASISRLTTDPAIDGALYFWEQYSTNNTHILGRYEGGYGIRNLAGGLAPSATGVEFISGTGTTSKFAPKQYIPVGQGFFVIGKIGTSGIVTFNNSQRAFVKEDDEASQTMYKKPSKPKGLNHWTDNSNDPIKKDMHKRIRLGYNIYKQSFHRQVLLAFMDEKANSELNNGYDAFNIDDFPSDMYLLNGENELAIEGEGYFDPTASYPIGVRSEKTGKVSFVLDGLENFDKNQPIFIYDKSDDTYHNIKDAKYEVLLPAGIINNRFVLRFTDKTLGLKDPVYENDIQVDFIRSTSILNIVNSSKDNTINTVSLFNILGKSISKWEVSEKEQTNIKIPIQNTASGVYIVKLKTIKGTVSKKIIVP